jgi:hypothetical protein
MDTNESITINQTERFSTETSATLMGNGIYLLKEDGQIEIKGNTKLSQKTYHKNNSSKDDFSGYGVLPENSEIKVDVAGKFEILSENNVIKLILKDDNDIIGMNKFIKIADI